MSKKTDAQHAADLALTAGTLLREAGSGLHAGLGGGQDWMSLTYEEKTEWGSYAAAPVVSTLLVTKPEGWQELSQEVINTAQRWANEAQARASQKGTP